MYPFLNYGVVDLTVEMSNIDHPRIFYIEFNLYTFQW